MKEKEKEKLRPIIGIFGEDIEIRGRESTHLKLHLTILAIVIICEFIGIIKYHVAGGYVMLLPMLWAVIIGLAITPPALGKFFKSLQRAVSMKECELAAPIVIVALYPLAVKYGTLVGPVVGYIIKAGPALIFQEFGNLGTIFLALPVALLLGMKRSAVGAAVSICREPTLGVVGERYTLSSPEGLGTLGIYLCGTIFGTIFFCILGGLSPAIGLHPYALAMACGMGSASMMTASSAALSAAVPAMKGKILAFAVTSNLLTGVTGLYMVIIISLPLVNYLYSKWYPHLDLDERRKRREEKRKRKEKR